MKTKTIFKTLALAMMMPAMLLTTACSSDDDSIINNENINKQNTAKKGYALPVTVNVTRQGDAATRASFDGSKLNFSAGDKLFVYGSTTAAGSFAGELDYVPASENFSGTIYTENQYTGTADALFTAASAGENLTATLLPNGYDANGSNSFLSINNNSTTDIAYDDRLTVSGSYAFVASETAKATGVEQLSLERTSTYSSCFALSPGNAILNFTISGLAAETQNVSLRIHNGFDYDVFGSVTPNASGVATFAIGVPVGANIKEMSNNLTVGSSNFTLPSSTTFAAGKIYNITRAAAPAPSYTMAAAATTSDKGKLICTAGHIHVYSEDAACTAGRVAKIIYVGTNGHATYNHGLALALVDMSTKLTWDNSGTDNDGKTAAEWCSAWNTSKPVNAAEWLLASKDQWDYMLGTSGAGSYTTLRDGFESVGGSNMKMARYWSSMEFDSYRGMYYQFSRGEWDFEFKNENYYVRAALAF